MMRDDGDAQSAERETALEARSVDAREADCKKSKCDTYLPYLHYLSTGSLAGKCLT